MVTYSRKLLALLFVPMMAACGAGDEGYEEEAPVDDALIGDISMADPAALKEAGAVAEEEAPANAADVGEVNILIEPAQNDIKAPIENVGYCQHCIAICSINGYPYAFDRGVHNNCSDAAFAYCRDKWHASLANAYCG